MDTLVYVDPSPRGGWALGMAALLPPAYQASVILLATAEDVEAHPALLAEARARLAVASTETLVLPGPAEHAVVTAANAHRYDLLVVPPAGRGALARMLKGSRVATVVKSVRAPVLVARRPPERVTRLLAAVSRGRSLPTVVAAARDLAGGLGAELRFLHVSSQVVLPFHPEGHQAPAPAEGSAGLPEGLSAEDTIRRALSECGLPVDQLVIREGLVVDELLEEFEHGAYHLLLLGTGSEPAGSSWGRDDVTERILLRCPGSTLIVPSR
jgi:nucleotide-binding universal stress UspA family protein